jgi:hypothetical protein
VPRRRDRAARSQQGVAAPQSAVCGEGEGVRRERDGRRAAAGARWPRRDDPDAVRARLTTDRPRDARDDEPPPWRARTQEGLTARAGTWSGPPRGERSGPLSGHLPEWPLVADEGEPMPDCCCRVLSGTSPKQRNRRLPERAGPSECPRSRSLPDQSNRASTRGGPARGQCAGGEAGVGYPALDAQARLPIVRSPDLHRGATRIAVRGGATLPALWRVPQRRAARQRSTGLRAAPEPARRPGAPDRGGAPRSGATGGTSAEARRVVIPRQVGTASSGRGGSTRR